MSDVRILPVRAADGAESFVLLAEQLLPGLPREVFPFYADAHNLERITPAWLRFRILTPSPVEMGEGTLLDYRLRLHGVPVAWRTRITVWDPPHRFVDDQVSGPYKLWRHEHLFEDAPGGGTLARDRIEYQLYGGRLLQRAANAALVQRDLRAIFEYRRERLGEVFGP